MKSIETKIKNLLLIEPKIFEDSRGFFMESYNYSTFKELGIDHLENKLPKDLSGGERQRLAIARALYNNPAIILADEPTASLDSDRAFEVVDLLSKECKEKNKSIIMVTHDNRMIEKCDHVYRMKNGILIKER